jgi:low affinity Fe/Cu permease
MKPSNGNGLFGNWFGKTAAKTAGWVGSPWAFTFAVLTIVLWGASGTYFHYSDTWQLVINTGTTIITFLVVFLIQNTQNRNDRAVQLKLDEIIRAIHSAHNEMIDIEELSDAELEQLAKQYHRVREECELREAKKKRMAS